MRDLEVQEGQAFLLNTKLNRLVAAAKVVLLEFFVQTSYVLFADVRGFEDLEAELADVNRGTDCQLVHHALLADCIVTMSEATIDLFCIILLLFRRQLFLLNGTELVDSRRGLYLRRFIFLFLLF